MLSGNGELEYVDLSNAQVTEIDPDAFQPGLLNRILTRRFPTVSYALVPACTKLAHFGLREVIAQD